MTRKDAEEWGMVALCYLTAAIAALILFCN